MRVFLHAQTCPDLQHIFTYPYLWESFCLCWMEKSLISVEIKKVFYPWTADWRRRRQRGVMTTRSWCGHYVILMDVSRLERSILVLYARRVNLELGRLVVLFSVLSWRDRQTDKKPALRVESWSWYCSSCFCVKRKNNKKIRLAILTDRLLGYFLWSLRPLSRRHYSCKDQSLLQ